jgi:mRNA-degrading endonuclease toxin of MazEF toxin-antitoxin module
MANTYTSNLQLAMPAPGDRTWNVPVNRNSQALDALAPVGALVVVTTEVPSATFNVHVAAGNYLKQDGTIGTYAGAVSTPMTPSTTNYLYLDLTNSGTLAVNTSGFPATPHVRLATVVAGSSTITTITDVRVAFHVVGSFGEGVNLTFGTATGTQIGTAANQKLAFFGKTPVVQPTLGAATAGTSYTSNEQTMLNTVYAAVRLLGLGS